MREFWHIIRRETAAFFSSPVAYLFIGTFLAVNLFVFFWADAFFARNIADVRPLFQWMPLLLVFLVAALTMRAWSEERRSGTLELLLTSPVSSTRLVLGKFAAALILVSVALALTLPLPFTVSMLGPLDWGPVIGGYAATLFLAGAYVAIGLFVSSRTDNQIVSLIVTVLIAAVLYLVGSDWLTALVGRDAGEVLRLIGTGSRFDSITRGVLDLRDIYYYLSLAGVFLALNVYSLETIRWAGDNAGARRHRSWRVAVTLVVANLLVANVWLEPISSARADLTQGSRYTISSATRLYLSRLQEPLLIRGYFSRKTHPLLAPLVPQLEDLLKEYAESGGDNVHLQIVDPQKDPAAAREAKQRYGIEPVPFQTESRYESSVVSSYFNVLVKYGDQYKVLDYRDLVSVKGGARGDVSVQLKDPEYAITRAVRKVAYQWQGGGNPFAAIGQPVTFHGYISPKDELPDQLADLRDKLGDMLQKLKAKSDGKLKVDFADPQADGGALARKLRKQYGFRPMTTSLLDQNRFYFYMVLQQGGRTVPVPLPASLDPKDVHKAVTSALEQFGQGFLKTVALYTPGGSSPYSRGPHFRALQRTLRQNDAVADTDLESGHVPPGTDLLLVVAPKTLDEKQRFAVDQFLMQGGTVIVAASPLDVNVSYRQGIRASKVKTGLADWLAHYGVHVPQKLVLDPQSDALTLPTRDAYGNVTLETVKYPYFIDVRADGFADVPLLGHPGQLSMAWASPVHLDDKLPDGLKGSVLIHSSPRAWTSDSTNVVPNLDRYPRMGFKPGKSRGVQPLAVMLKGRFTSAFADSGSPLKAAGNDGNDGKDGTAGDAAKGADAAKGSGKDQSPVVRSVIDHSPASSRLIVIGSGAFLSDAALNIVGGTAQTAYRKPVQLTQNLVDASLEDPAMLSIRGRSEYTRLLRPMSDDARSFWEGLNYALALFGLAVVYGVRRAVTSRRRSWYRDVLDGEDG